MGMKNLTPPQYRCTFSASCPSVFKSDDGKSYIIIGKITSSQHHPELYAKVGVGEEAVEIPRDLLEEALGKAAEADEVSEAKF
jgi:hypothetical protein